LKQVSRSQRDDGQMHAMGGRVSTPAIPTGDDDMPNRTGPGRGTVGGSTVAPADGGSWGVRNFLFVLHQRWIRWVGYVRSF
jgi:hypothetical protein